MKRVTKIVAFLFMSACGSMQVYELPKVQKDLLATLEKSQAVTQQSGADYATKKALVENLSRSNNKDFRSSEADLRRHLGAMDEALQSMLNQKKGMSEASGEVASLSYSHQKVRSDEAEFPRVEDALTRFQAATTELNASVADYSRESNSLADIIRDKKLYYTFDVEAFQKRVQTGVRTAQDNQENMQKELTRAQNILEGNKTPSAPTQTKVLEQLRTLANDYTERAGRFAKLSRDVHGLTLGMAKTSTLDEGWPRVQKLVNEFDTTVTDLSAMNENFTKKLTEFRSAR